MEPGKTLRFHFTFFLCILFGSVLGEFSPGDTPPPVVLSGDLGGRMDGRPWCSDSCNGRLTAIFYVDPDERTLNQPAFDSLKAAGFPEDRFFSIAVLNLAATWMPDAILKALLKQKQKKFPRTVYVNDLKKTLVKVWGLRDNSSDIIVLGKEGKVLFSRDGKLSENDLKRMMALIRENL